MYKKDQIVIHMVDSEMGLFLLYSALDKKYIYLKFS